MTLSYQTLVITNVVLRFPDVYRYLKKRREELHLVHLEGTHLVAYRQPLVGTKA